MNWDEGKAGLKIANLWIIRQKAASNCQAVWDKITSFIVNSMRFVVRAS
jgi:hypothetical protein